MQYFIYKEINIKPALILWHKDIKGLIKNSFSLRLAYQIISLKDLITSNILSNFPSGYLSSYYYAFRIISTAYSIITTPFSQIYNSKVSRLISLKEFISLKNEILLYIKNSFLYLSLIFVFLAIFLKPALSLLLHNSLSDRNVNDIYSIFLFFISFFYFMLMESSLSLIAIAYKKIKIILIAAISYLIVYFISIYFTIDKISIYSIPVSFTITQIFTFLFYFVLFIRMKKRNVYLHN